MYHSFYSPQSCIDCIIVSEGTQRRTKNIKHMTYDDQFESAVFITEWPERKCSKHESGHQYRLYITNLSRSCATGHIPLENSNNILYATAPSLSKPAKCVVSTFYYSKPQFTFVKLKIAAYDILAGCTQFHVRSQTKGQIIGLII